DTCATAVRTAIEAGYRHIDTAEMYENEAPVGRGIERADVSRDELFVATKVNSPNLAYDDVLDHARQSRDRLGLDVVDLLYVHWPIRAYDPESTLAAFEDLHAEGVIRHVGVSNFTPALLAEAFELLSVPVAAHQVECHPYLPQDELRRHARDNGHRLVAYSPLAQGAVLDDPVIVEVAEAHEATPAQVALAWLRSKAGVVPIPRSSSPTHIRENLGALELDLDERAIERIDGIERRERVVDFPEAPWNR
ncbi:MAG: aldo/keto reductase, partial [Halobacteriota archaeon]